MFSQVHSACCKVAAARMVAEEAHLGPGHWWQCCCKHCLAAVEALLHKHQVDPVPDLDNVPAGHSDICAPGLPASEPDNPHDYVLDLQ